MVDVEAYQKYTEITPEIIEQILKHKDTEVTAVGAPADYLDNEALPVGWVRRIVRMLIKSGVVAAVELKLYTGVAGALTTQINEFNVANLSVLPMETHDFRVGLFKLVGSATDNRFTAIVDANSALVETWYFDWPW